MTWQRPAGEYPRIWLKENGFVIRDVSPDIQEYVMTFMVENYFRDEPMHQGLNALEDPEAIAELTEFWYREFLPHKMCIVALEENDPGADLQPVDPQNPPRILGVNMLKVAHKNDVEPPAIESVYKTRIARLITKTVTIAGKLDDVYERYHVTHYLDAAGLLVSPNYRGKGLGQLLLRARIEIGKAFNIPLTKTIFTNIASQKVAKKAGFELLGEKNYDTYTDDDGCTKIFKDMLANKSIQLWARRLY